MSSRAVVVGSGIAGLLAAAAVRRHVEEVVILERDQLPNSPTPRRGVRQSEHLHNLLGRAQLHLAELLPGALERILADGGACAGVSMDTHVFELGVEMPERDLSMRLMSAPRPLIEHVARRIVSEDYDVRIEDESSVVALLARHNAITGVALAGGLTYAADVVIDATGAATRAGEWVGATGSEAARVETHVVDQWYVSGLFRRPRGWRGHPDFFLTFPTPPTPGLGGLISPRGDEDWHACVSGHGNGALPATPDELVARARCLEHPAIGDLLGESLALGPTTAFRCHAEVWRHYEEVEAPLIGFLALGDSVASLNPIYGQGMSVAAWQATELMHAFEAHASCIPDLTAAYQGRAASVVEQVWRLGSAIAGAMGGSASIDGEGARSLGELMHKDCELHRTYVRAWHLLEPVSRLEELRLAQRLKARSAPTTVDQGPG